MPPKRSRFIPIAKVREGQEFRHYGNLYRRATETEVTRHPARELCEARSQPTVLAYGFERGRKTPLSFIAVDSEGAELKVIVAADGGSI